MVEVVRELQFEDLALAERGVGAGDEGNGLFAERCGHLRCPSQEEVTRQDGDGVRPVAVDGSEAAAGLRLVDDIVVVERSEMDELDGRRRPRPAPSPSFGPQLGGDLGQQRSIALAAGSQEVLGDLGEERALAPW